MKERDSGRKKIRLSPLEKENPGVKKGIPRRKVQWKKHWKASTTGKKRASTERIKDRYKIGSGKQTKGGGSRRDTERESGLTSAL